MVPNTQVSSTLIGVPILSMGFLEHVQGFGDQNNLHHLRPLRPQSDGQVEGVNANLQKMLATI